MRRIPRLALASACATGLAVPALAQSIEATIRVEGAGSTAIPASPQDVAGSGTTLVTDTIDGDSITVSSRSATAQLAIAAGSRSLPFGFDLFDFGSSPTSFVNRIGPDSTPSDFSAFWLFRVNHVASPVGSDDALLSAGDEVLWFYGPPGIDTELDVTPPSAPVRAGERFTVNVRGFDADGVAAPASGARVSYGGATATTNARGVATLTASDAGTQSVVASAPDSIRDSASVCGYPASDPTVCGLPTTAVPATPGARSASGAPVVCRDVSTRSASSPASSAARPTDATYRKMQWHARVTMQRVAAMHAWLDAGIESGDLCGGAIGQTALVGGIMLDDGAPTNLASPPNPRQIALDPPPAPTSRSGAPARPRLATATRTITIEALKRVNDLAARIRGGLTGGDLRPETVGARELAPGARVTAASPGAVGASASSAPKAGPTSVRGFRPTSATAAKDLRVARAGLRRSSQLFEDLRSGLGPDAFAPTSIGTVSLSPSVRP